MEGGDAAELGEAGADRFSVWLLEALKQAIGGAQVLDDNRTRAAVYAARLDEVEVTVGACVDNPTLDTGHSV